MKVHHNILELPQFERAVLTIGTFDGVHLGHRKIIEQLVNEANRVNGTSIVLTFFPHPKHVVGNNSDAVLLLNTLEKIKIYGLEVIHPVLNYILLKTLYYTIEYTINKCQKTHKNKPYDKL